MQTLWLKFMVRRNSVFDNRIPVQILLSIFLLLTLFIWISGLSSFQHYRVSELAFSNSFPGPAESWIYRGSPENIIVTKSSITLRREKSGYSGVRKFIELPPSLKQEYKIRVTIDGIIKPISISQHGRKNLLQAGTLKHKNYNQPYLTLQAFDKSNVQLGVSHIGKIPNKPTSFQVSKFYTPPPDTTDIALGLLLRHSHSQVTINSAKVEIVKQRNIYIIFSRALFFTLFSLALYCCVRLSNRLHPLFLMTGVLLSCTLLLLLTVSVKTQLTYINLALSTVGLAISDRDTHTNQWLVSSCHIIIFTIAGCYMYLLAIKIKLKIRYCVAFLFLLAIAGEVIQLHLAERTININDLAFNITGIILSVTLCRGFQVLHTN